MPELTFAAKKYPAPEDLLQELSQIQPNQMDDSLIVELAWEYGLSPDIVQRAYILMLDGVS